MWYFIVSFFLFFWFRLLLIDRIRTKIKDHCLHILTEIGNWEHFHYCLNIYHNSNEISMIFNLKHWTFPGFYPKVYEYFKYR